MQLSVHVAPRNAFAKSDLFAMHRLRAKVFSDRKGWQVPVMSGMEIDGYDALDPYYMLLREQSGLLRGCWRLLPTEGPYMLRDTFPQLLHGEPAPCAPDVWELSRFAMENSGQPGFGFSDVALQSVCEIIRFGHGHGIREYVTVTTTSVERMLTRAGVVLRRFGPALEVGVETAVAVRVDIAASMAHLGLALHQSGLYMRH
ncbi:MAG: acyl-homoserine-lactone synthase [Burkholderiaceae bacterium]|nr:acyl-homoserine-lactone synthase [Burkholderiaceae bacterium]